MKQIFRLSFFITLPLTLFSCASAKLVTTAVAYQSVRTVENKASISPNAKIVVGYSITTDGAIIAAVRNLTDEIMIIDQTKSFFVNSNGESTSYYDPTIRSTSTTRYSSTTDGVSVNLGALGSVLGIGGPLGGLLNGITVGEAETEGYSTTHMTQFADQPQISLAPKSYGLMSKEFSIIGVGRPYLKYLNETNTAFTSENSNCKFKVCISYSLDGGNSFEKIITSFYVNSIITSPVPSHGKVNDALRKILSRKSDAIHESWWMLYSVNNIECNDSFFNGALTDYQ